jgi:hypothetical protein
VKLILSRGGATASCNFIALTQAGHVNGSCDDGSANGNYHQTPVDLSECKQTGASDPDCGRNYSVLTRLRHLDAGIRFDTGKGQLACYDNYGTIG